MQFPYRKLFDRDATTGKLDLVQRPEITMTIIGPQRQLECDALVDTGADTTVLPVSVARTLRIPLAPSTRGGTAFRGGKFPLLRGSVRFQIGSGDAIVRWAVNCFFAEFESKRQETLVLGQADFLEYFRATFDWEKGMLTLDPNGRFPTTD